MNFEEHAAKPLLARAGIAVPDGRLVTTAAAAGEAARELGAVVVKAQAPTGKRGKAGGIRPADTPAEAEDAAAAILGMEIAGHPIERLLVERRAAIAKEYYAAVLNDPQSRGPLVLFSTSGGMDIEEAAEESPDALRRLTFDVRSGLDEAQAGSVRAPDGLVAGPAPDHFGARGDRDHGIRQLESQADLVGAQICDGDEVSFHRVILPFLRARLRGPRGLRRSRSR